MMTHVSSTAHTIWHLIKQRCVWSFHWSLCVYCERMMSLKRNNWFHQFSVFICSFLLLAPLFGYLGDRYNRKYIMIGGLSVWLLTATASSFVNESVSEEYFTRNNKVTQLCIATCSLCSLRCSNSSHVCWKGSWISTFDSVFVVQGSFLTRLHQLSRTLVRQKLKVQDG